MRGGGTLNGPEEGLEACLHSFSPLVKKLARRYEGRGAEYEDLVQEGYLALLRLVPRCRKRCHIALFLQKSLPSEIRDAARRLRRHRAVPLEELEGTGGEPSIEEEEIPVTVDLERLLPASDLKLVGMLLEGWTQREIGRLLCLSQQAISARVRKVRERLAPFKRHLS